MSVAYHRLSFIPLLLVATACFPDVDATIKNANAQAAQAIQVAKTGQISGTLNVNAAPYPAIRCSAGSASGFNGVDIFGSDGSKLRFVAEVDGTSTVYYFTPANPGAGVAMKGCAALNVRPSGVVINGVPMVNGNVQLNCTSAGVHVDGFVGFGCG